MSCGYKHGAPPADAAFVLDCRSFKNPFYEPHLKELTGEDKPVQQFLENEESVEVGQMIDIFEYSGNDFKAVMQYEGWKIGLLRYGERFSALNQMERHALTDEVFVLLSGMATLYIMDEENNSKEFVMEQNKVYNIKKNTWHHIVVSEDSTVLVVENSNTNKENTEKVNL